MATLRAIENGANFLAEGFLFSVAVGLIIGETWRSSRSQSKQRSDVNDSIEELQTRVRELDERLRTWEEAALEERQRCVTSHGCTSFANSQGRHQELARIIERVVEIGLRGGAWAEVQNDTPLQPPHIQANRSLPMSSSAPYVNAERTHTKWSSRPAPANTIPSSTDTRDAP